MQSKQHKERVLGRLPGGRVVTMLAAIPWLFQARVQPFHKGGGITSKERAHRRRVGRIARASRKANRR